MIKRKLLPLVLLFVVTLLGNATELKRDGWNLVSVCQNINKADMNMEGIEEIQNQNGLSIYTGDFSEYSNLELLEAGYGYWVKSTNGVKFDGGESNKGFMKPLTRKGWNLMGVCQDINSSDLNMSNFKEIQSQDGKTIYTGDFKEYSNLDTLVSGYGYWVSGDINTSWTVDDGMSIPSNFKYPAINNLGEVVEITNSGYVIKIFSDSNESADSQANHVGVVVKINGDSLPIMQIQNSYEGKHLVVGVYLNGELVGVSEVVLVNGNMTIPIIVTEGNGIVTESDYFITTWKTDNTGYSNDKQIKIGTQSSKYAYNYTIDWGDGSIERGVVGDINHTYSEIGTYTVKIYGEFPQIYFGFGEYDNRKLLSVEQWGTIQWKSMDGAFLRCSNVVIKATDKPNLSHVKSMNSMFNGVNHIEQDITDWNVSTVTSMRHLFCFARNFNQDISGWDVSNVTNMYDMFLGASQFNQDIGSWDVSNVTTMFQMFYMARTFNQDVSDWNVSKVAEMGQMFEDATLSTENYDALLKKWSKLNLKNNVTFHGGNSKYTQDANSSRQSIIDNFNWTITDGGMESDTTPPSKPTLTTQAPSDTTDSNVTVEVNGEVGAKIYLNGVEVGTIGSDGKLSIVLNLNVGNNSFAIVLKDAQKNESEALEFAVNRSESQELGLLINELSSAKYTNSARWFELYNSSSSEIDISDYTLKSRYYDGSEDGIFEFSLPSKIIPPKGYLVIKSNYGPAFNTTLPNVENEEVIYLKDSASNKYPSWYSNSNGFLELIKAGKTVDFITFGKSFTPTTDVAWSETYVASFGDEGWKSIARAIDTDTNTSEDWTVREFPTYAGLNDVTCNDDEDEDGIPDCSEISGSTYTGMDLYALGARVNQKDIFIEVDYMDSTDGGALELDEGVVPQQKALEKVRDAFATNGYSVHFDVGDLFAQDGSVINPALMDLGGGNEVAYAKSVHLGCTNAGVEARDYKAENMKPQRKQIFHYMLFGTSQRDDGEGGSSGCAENPGNDSLMTLGGWNLKTDTTVNSNILINFQSGTVMHEFGHNLGLKHGGDENENYKPNYMSVMNYLYQLHGLSTIGNNEGDRYYYKKGCTSQYDDITNPYSGDPDDFILDYSHGLGGTLDEENGVDEANGLRQSNSGYVNFNCDSSNNDVLTDFNVNPNYSSVISTLHDYDDWSSLNIVFARTYSGNSGASNSSSNRVIVENPVWNDVQRIAEEEPIDIPSIIKE